MKEPNVKKPGQVKKSKPISPKTVVGQYTSFSERLIDVVPFIDPDSTRFIEWIWAIRHELGKSTYARQFNVPSNLEVSMDELSALVVNDFNTVYDSPSYFRGIRFCKDGSPDFIVAIGKVNGAFSVVAAGDKEIAEEIIERYKSVFTPPAIISIQQLTGFKHDGSSVVKENQLKEDEISIADDSFYPWLREGIDAYIDKFKKSKSNVILLIGPPGTGKSTFLRTLLFKMKAKHNYLVYNEQTLMNIHFVHWLEDVKKNSVIAIEDADNFVAKRKDANHQMSALLNYVEGVIPNNSKVIISTNLETRSRVDEALLRVGRNFDVMEFRKLTREEANVARVSNGLKEINFFEEHKELTLANALNYETIHRDDFEKHQGSQFGFVPKK